MARPSAQDFGRRGHHGDAHGRFFGPPTVSIAAENASIHHGVGFKVLHTHVRIKVAQGDLAVMQITLHLAGGDQ
eukprot:scaffold34623_cov274-Amphora_coffeaeformis.AAC.8